jgi:hypothetical protein
MNENAPTELNPAHSEGRRRFLRKATLAGSGAAAVAVVPGLVAAAPEVEAVAPEATKLGYQETQHVRDYYRSASS